MQIRIQSTQTSYVIGEEISVNVELINTGSAPVTLPALDDPSSPQYFVISGPSFPKPHRIHWSGKAPSAKAQPESSKTVGPGLSLSAALSLPTSVVFRNPGKHELFATYDWMGTAIESNRIELQMEPHGPPLFRLVGRTPLQPDVEISALSVNGSALYLATFDEARPEIGETSFTGLSRIGSADPGATDFFAPWCQTAEPGVIGPRFGWRKDSTITLAGFHKVNQPLKLPFEPKIHGPSLMVANGDIDALVTDAAGKRLALLHFPNVDYDTNPPAASIVWTKEVSEPIADMTATINPSGARFAVLRQGNMISLVTWDNSGPKIEPAGQVEGVALTAVAPAIHVSIAGVVRASILTADVNQAHRLSITEFTWKKGEPAEIKKGEAFEIPKAIRSGTVAYTMSAVETPRREWFFVLEDGKVVTSKAQGKVRPTSRLVSLPPQLAVMSRFTYCVAYFENPRLISIL